MLRKRTRSVQKDQQLQHHHHLHMGHDATNLDHHHSHNQFLGLNHQSHSVFNAPPSCLFVGLGPKGLLDADSVRSPTSPLDARILSNHVRTPRSPSSSPSYQRSWDCCKVGLSLIDSLEDCSKFSGKILRCSESKSIGLTPKMMMIKSPNHNTYVDVDDSFESSSRSLPKDFCKAPSTQRIGSRFFNKGESESNVLFEIGDSSSGLEHNELFAKTRSCSLDSCSPLKKTVTDSSETESFVSKDVAVIKLSSPPHFIGGSSQNSNRVIPIGSSSEIVESLSASEIELSEDYTCVISHGPNPKTTHIFGDCILETHSNEFKNHLENEEKDKGVVSLVCNNRMMNTKFCYPSSDFLSFCHHCNKKLEEGKDIYIYRGEKSFCSLTCRALEIMIDEELEEEEESNPPPKNSPKQELGDQIFETGILTAT